MTTTATTNTTDTDTPIAIATAWSVPPRGTPVDVIAIVVVVGLGCGSMVRAAHISGGFVTSVEFTRILCQLATIRNWKCDINVSEAHYSVKSECTCLQPCHAIDEPRSNLVLRASPFTRGGRVWYSAVTWVVLFPRNPGEYEYANFVAAIRMCTSANHNCACLADKHSTERAVCRPCAVVSLSSQSIKRA